MTKAWIAELPDGRLLYGTKSDNPQSATAKAMMMDIPRGTRVLPFDADTMQRLPNESE